MPLVFVYVNTAAEKPVSWSFGVTVATQCCQDGWKSQLDLSPTGECDGLGTHLHFRFHRVGVTDMIRCPTDVDDLRALANYAADLYRGRLLDDNAVPPSLGQSYPLIVRRRR